MSRKPPATKTARAAPPDKRRRVASRPPGNTTAAASDAPLSVDRYYCYEHCVQNPAQLAPFLLAVHGGDPRILREDFCGTGGVCRAWAAMSTPSKRFSAIGVDLDLEPLQRLAGAPGVKAVAANVLECPARADVISATNFPVGYLYTRAELVSYLQLCHQRLRRGGIFVCDTYGGATAFTRGKLTRDVYTDDDIRIRYTWEQREANPLTARVIDALHFRADQKGELLYQEADAFVYHWRLWSVPELRDALAEAGFRSCDVYSQLLDARDSEGRTYVRPVDDPDELDESFIVLLAGRR